MKEWLKKKLAGNSSGFTLIEILVTVTILSIGLLGVATMQVSAIRANSVANDLTEGTTLASEKLEALMRIAANDYDNASLLDAKADGNAGLNNTGTNADFSETDGKYTISWNVVVNQPFTDTKTISIITTWVKAGATRKVSIQHIISKV